MAFVTKKKAVFNYQSPVDMYHDNKSANKTIMGLLDCKYHDGGKFYSRVAWRTRLYKDCETEWNNAEYQSSFCRADSG